MALAKEEISIITIGKGMIDTDVQGNSTTLDDLIGLAADPDEKMDANDITAITRTYQNNDGTIGVEVIQHSEFCLMVTEHKENVDAYHNHQQSYSSPE